MAHEKPPSSHQTQGVGNARTSTGVPARAAATLRGLLDQSLEPALYLVATPIGNLADVTLRALATITRADIVCAEDTRHSRRLLDHFTISRRLEPYHEHNARAQRPHLLDALETGQSVALISDAGTPLVSDPGYKLVREVLAAGHKVISIPGPSAPIAALTCAGLPTDTFLFAGFLPTKSGARQARIRALADVAATLIFFEAPSRIAATLHDLSSQLGPRTAAVARELTKLHEDIHTGSLDQLAAEIAEKPIKGEIVILVGPPVAADVTNEELSARLKHQLQTQSLRDAARTLADEFSVSRARVYELGLQLKQASDD